jgi:CDP-glucose 4,6-dehydratase
MESVVISSDFWRGKRVLVTGHTGFKGSWLSLWLQHLGADVTGYALEPSNHPSLFECARIGDHMASIISDVRDADRLCATIAEHKPQIVFHMAAQSLVRPSYEKPIDTYAVNVMGTVNLLDAVRRLGGVRALINVTSDKCYENREWLWGYRENDPMGGYDPYSSSKGCSELVTTAFRSSFFNPAQYGRHGVAVASARAGNVIGGGDWAKDRLVPDVMAAFIAGHPAMIRSPHAVRPWQHVLEPLHGYLVLGERLWADGPAHSEGWNFGPNDDDVVSVDRVVNQLALMWGRDCKWTAEGGNQPHEARLLKLDCSKAKARLGWSPNWDLSRALQEVVDWYRAFKQGVDMSALTLKQINCYTQELSKAKEHALQRIGLSERP